MWREETRFDKAFMERALAPDFFEFGRLGGERIRDSRSWTFLGSPSLLNCHWRTSE